MDLGLRDKNVLITGSTAGIGRRIANEGSFCCRGG